MKRILVENKNQTVDERNYLTDIKKLLDTITFEDPALGFTKMYSMLALSIEHRLNYIYSGISHYKEVLNDKDIEISANLQDVRKALDYYDLKLQEFIANYQPHFNRSELNILSQLRQKSINSLKYGMKIRNYSLNKKEVEELELDVNSALQSLLSSNNDTINLYIEKEYERVENLYNKNPNQTSKPNRETYEKMKLAHIDMADLIDSDQ